MPSAGDAADVVVLGAGPAGAVAAHALSRYGCRVTILEPPNGQPPPGPSPNGQPLPGPGRAGPELRIGESVPPEIRVVLDELGLLDGLRRGGHLESLGTASAWGSDELGYRDYLADPFGGGWHLDRIRFDRDLLAAAEAAGATVLPERFVAARGTLRGWELTCVRADGAVRTHAAGIVVDATGRRAAFAVTRGARRRRYDRLVGVASIVERADDVPAVGHTLVESAEDGWWYAAPVPDGRLVVALLSDADIVRGRGWTRPDAWGERLRATRHVRALCRPDGAAPPRLTSPPPSLAPVRLAVRSAGSQLLEPALGAGWVAVGDAASATDPLTSAGILSALRSGAGAAHAIASGRLSDVDWRREQQREARRRYDRYLAERRHFYGLEGRWHTPFWTRRRYAPHGVHRSMLHTVL